MKKRFKQFIGVLIIIAFVITPVIFFTNKNMERPGLKETIKVFNEEDINNNTIDTQITKTNDSTIEFFYAEKPIDFQITKSNDSTDEIDSSSYDSIRRLIDLYPQIMPYVNEALSDNKITKHENSRIWEFYSKHIREPEERKEEEEKKREIKKRLRNG